MKKSVYLVLSLLIVSFACEDKVTVTPIVFDNPVDFSSLAPGQKSVYKEYSAQCDDMEGSFNYTNNVIILEVVRENGALWFKETDSDGTLRTQYEVSVQDGRLFIPNRWGSALFFFYGNDFIELNPSTEVPLAQEGCRLRINDEIFIGDEIGKINSLIVGPINLENETAVSCVPVEMDLDAYLVHNSDELHLSHTIRDEVTVNGWVLAN